MKSVPLKPCSEFGKIILFFYNIWIKYFVCFKPVVSDVNFNECLATAYGNIDFPEEALCFVL